MVIQNNEVVLNMNETLDKGFGLSWEKPQNVSNGTLNINGMLAADAEVKNAKVVVKNGKYFVDFMGKGGSISWYQENDGSAGDFNLTFTYASNDETPRTMELIVNKKRIEILEFKSTGSWHSKWKDINIKASLQAGANYIELKTLGKSGPNILMLNVE